MVPTIVKTEDYYLPNDNVNQPSQQSMKSETNESLALPSALELPDIKTEQENATPTAENEEQFQYLTIPEEDLAAIQAAMEVVAGTNNRDPVQLQTESGAIYNVVLNEDGTMAIDFATVVPDEDKERKKEESTDENRAALLQSISELNYLGTNIENLNEDALAKALQKDEIQIIALPEESLGSSLGAAFPGIESDDGSEVTGFDEVREIQKKINETRNREGKRQIKTKHTIDCDCLKCNATLNRPKPPPQTTTTTQNTGVVRTGRRGRPPKSKSIAPVVFLPEACPPVNNEFQVLAESHPVFQYISELYKNRDQSETVKVAVRDSKQTLNYFNVRFTQVIGGASEIIRAVTLEPAKAPPHLAPTPRKPPEDDDATYEVDQDDDHSSGDFEFDDDEDDSNYGEKPRGRPRGRPPKHPPSYYQTPANVRLLQTTSGRKKHGGLLDGPFGLGNRTVHMPAQRGRKRKRHDSDEDWGPLSQYERNWKLIGTCNDGKPPLTFFEETQLANECGRRVMEKFDDDVMPLKNSGVMSYKNGIEVWFMLSNGHVVRYRVSRPNNIAKEDFSKIMGEELFFEIICNRIESRLREPPVRCKYSDLGVLRDPEIRKLPVPVSEDSAERKWAIKFVIWKKGFLTNTFNSQRDAYDWLRNEHAVRNWLQNQTVSDRARRSHNAVFVPMPGYDEGIEMGIAVQQFADSIKFDVVTCFYINKEFIETALQENAPRVGFHSSPRWGTTHRLDDIYRIKPGKERELSKLYKKSLVEINFECCGRTPECKAQCLHPLNECIATIDMKCSACEYDLTLDKKDPPCANCGNVYYDTKTKINNSFFCRQCSGYYRTHKKHRNYVNSRSYVFHPHFKCPWRIKLVLNVSNPSKFQVLERRENSTVHSLDVVQVGRKLKPSEKDFADSRGFSMPNDPKLYTRNFLMKIQSRRTLARRRMLAMHPELRQPRGQYRKSMQPLNMNRRRLGRNSLNIARQLGKEIPHYVNFSEKAVENLQSLRQQGEISFAASPSDNETNFGYESLALPEHYYNKVVNEESYQPNSFSRINPNDAQNILIKNDDPYTEGEKQVKQETDESTLVNDFQETANDAEASTIFILEDSDGQQQIVTAAQLQELEAGMSQTDTPNIQLLTEDGSTDGAVGQVNLITTESDLSPELIANLMRTGQFTEDSNQLAVNYLSSEIDSKKVSNSESSDLLCTNPDDSNPVSSMA